MFAGYKQIILADFEYGAAPGSNPVPRCLVAHDLVSGQWWRVSEDELLQTKEPPFATGEDALFVSYYASAELGCFLALGWPMPRHVLDLCAEFKKLTNGLDTPAGKSLLGALAYYNLPGVESVEKDSMRALALRGGPWHAGELEALLVYCESDVTALCRLLAAMRSTLDLPRALLRGRYMKSAAVMEFTGTPIDVELLSELRTHWSAIQAQVIGRINADFDIYDGLTFKVEKFERWLIDHQIPWPRLESGRLALDDDSFSDMSKTYPILVPIKECRAMLAKMRLEELAVAPDERNRTVLWAFNASSGRNAPGTNKFIFGLPAWMRGLIKPAPGHGLAYCDWSQQEFAIAAYLSGDRAMQLAYETGDPYLAFAIQAGAAPAGATKESHGAVREQFKSTSLAVLYGMQAPALAVRLGQPTSTARALLASHKQTYSRFWEWSAAVLDSAMLTGTLSTTFGWEVHVGNNNGRPKGPRSLQNFAVQGNGAEMLRLACIGATEAGIRVCCPVHDALLIEAPLAKLDQAIAGTRAVMEAASRAVLGGATVRVDAKVVRHPDRYEDGRGARMWAETMAALRRLR